MKKTTSGAVSAQVAAGEQVTINITRPDGVVDPVAAFTQADLSYSAEYQAQLAGTYSVVAHIDEDAQYSAADSPMVEFTIGKTPRTITLQIS